jgi:hypothetical protein
VNRPDSFYDIILFSDFEYPSTGELIEAAVIQNAALHGNN